MKVFGQDSLSAGRGADKPDRTPDESEQMVRLSRTSTWHRTQRPGCTAQNLSVGYWQTSRIYSLLGRASAAQHYRQLGLQGIRAAGDMPFYLGHAFEALGHAELVADDMAKMAEYLALAQEAAGRVPDVEARVTLLADLANIR